MPELITPSRCCRFADYPPTTDLKPKSRNDTPKEISHNQSQLSSGTETNSQERTDPQAVASTPTVGTQFSSSGLENSDDSVLMFPKIELPDVSVSTLESWHVLCDLYYKGTPWTPEHKIGFQDSASALAHFALRQCHHTHLQSGEFSETVLWTCEMREIPRRRPRINQAFTVYPPMDGPRRIELAKDACLKWAIITFTNNPTAVKPAQFTWEDERLVTAVRNIISLGYHVDVWTVCDELAWEDEIELAEAEYLQVVEGKTQPTNQANVDSDPDDNQRRERYQACLRHGLAGFSHDELTRLKTLQTAIQQAKRLALELDEDSYVFVGAEQNDEVKPMPTARRPRSALQKSQGHEREVFSI